MATYTVQAKAIYRYGIDDQKQRVINQVITDPNTVISNANNGYRFLLCFDVSNIPYFGRTDQSKLILTVDSFPSSWSSVGSKGNLIKSVPQSGFNVGDVITYSKSPGATSITYASSNDWQVNPSRDGYFVSATDDVVYFDCEIRPFNSQGSETDKEIKFHNARIQFDSVADNAFVALSDVGSGYHHHNTSLPITLSSKYDTFSLRQHKVVGGTAYYKTTSASSYTSLSFTGSTVTIPANVFANNQTYEIYVDATSNSGAASVTAVAEITTADSIGSCIGISPQNEVLYGDVVFRWSYSVSTGTAQKAYDIQISPDGETWTNIFSHVVSSETSAIYSQTASGNTYWRVRGYNQSDVAGQWSDPLFYINNVPPQPPVIRSVTGNGLQTVAWSADAQIAYHVRVLSSANNIVYDTGEVYSTSGSVLIDYFLENDTYSFQVRIASAIGGWSEWASLEKTITSGIANPVFTLTANESGVVISINPIGNSVSFLIYRDGDLIGITDSTFTDYFAAGNVTYKVVGLSSYSEKYGYTIKSFFFAPAHNQIVTEDGEIFLVNRRLNERSFPQKSISPKYEAYEFLGENRPTHVFVDDFRSGSFTVAIYDKEGRADELLGKKIFFGTAAGWGDWCVVTAINRREVLLGNDVAITMELTSKPEITV